MMRHTCVIYHANCVDGFTAAWVAWKNGLKTEEGPVTYISANYGDPVPMMEEDSDVYILDFSYPGAQLEAIQDRSRSLIVLDHHKTAEADLRDFQARALDVIEFDMGKSGAMLAWEYFFPNQSTPLLVEYVQDRDLWKFIQPDSKAVNANIRSWPFDFESYTSIHTALEHNFGGFALEGQAILRMNAKLVDDMVQRPTIVAAKDSGQRFLAVNASVLFSEAADELLKRNPSEKVAGYWFDRGDGKRQWGLRSTPDYDCSVLAKALGGGGRAQASGFTEDGAWQKVIRIGKAEDAGK